MDREMKARIEEAKRYQKLALRALLPDSVAGHMDVIEKEIRAMVMEGAADLGRIGLNRYLDRAGGNKDDDTGSGKNIKNITIS